MRQGHDSGQQAVLVGAGNGAGQLQIPCDVAFDASGSMYVADFANNRIQKFASGSVSGTNATTIAGGGSTSASTLNGPIAVRLDAGGLGPFAGGYGFGVRSTLLGYFMKLDAGWPMKGVFVGKPVWYFALGFDF